MTAISPTARMVSSPGYNRSGVVQTYQAGGTVGLGEAVYLDSNNKVQRAIATASATSRAIGIVVGVSSQYAETTQAANGWVDVCVHGVVDLGPLSTDLTQGQQIWVSKDSAGGLVDAAPSTAYDWIIAQALGPSKIFVNPGNVAPSSVA